jgi:transcriptional regulator with XRE-family HTH domain
VTIPHDTSTCPTCAGVGTLTRVSGTGIRAIREASGWSLRQVAKELRISPAYLSDMELGKRGMSEETAQRIIHICENEGGSR